MDIKRLKQMGAVITPTPIPVEVLWAHRDRETGELMEDKFIVHVLPPSIGWMDRIARRSAVDDRVSHTAMLISEGMLFGEEANERLDYADASQLETELARALMVAFNKVQKELRDPTKNSQPPTSSGSTSLPAESAEEQ